MIYFCSRGFFFCSRDNFFFDPILSRDNSLFTFFNLWLLFFCSRDIYLLFLSMFFRQSFVYVLYQGRYNAKNSKSEFCFILWHIGVRTIHACAKKKEIAIQ